MRLHEMTMRTSNFDDLADNYAKTNANRWQTRAKPIGLIGRYVVKRDGMYYSVWDDNTMVASLSISSQTPSIIDDVWVSRTHRGQKIFSKMLQFAIIKLKKHTLMFGDVHSMTTYEIVKDGLSNFKKTWFNIRTNEIMPHSEEILDKVYSSRAPTAWRLLLTMKDISDK